MKTALPKTQLSTKKTKSSLVPSTKYKVLKLPKSGNDKSKNKPKSRLIFVSCGDADAELLVDLTLPTALSSGNIPALIKRMFCDVVILTESRLFGFFKKHPTISLLRNYCEIRLVSIDDLLYPRNEVVTELDKLIITFAYFRGFEDLGSEMTKHHLLFLPTGFVVADGSLRTLANTILSGKNLVVAPSYLTVVSEAAPVFRSQFNSNTNTITVQPREMAKIILRHRHSLIRAKTVNQRIFHCNVMDQFYWEVNEHTLLGQQAPCAIIAIKLEHEIYQMNTYWDYGIISEAMTKTKITMLNDSDDFLVVDIKSSKSKSWKLQPGWPSYLKIALSLGYTTIDHRTLSLFPSCLHSRDLPPNLEAAKRQLEYFVDQVWKVSDAPFQHLNHIYWCHHKALFDNNKFNFFNKKINVLRAPFEGNAKEQYLSDGVSKLNWPRRIHKKFCGSVPFVKPLHIMWPYLSKAREFLDEACTGRTNALLIMSPSYPGYLGNEYFTYVTGKHVRMKPFTAISNLMPTNFLYNKKYDVCYCELWSTDLLLIKQICEKVFNHLKEGAPIIIFCFSIDRSLDPSFRDDEFQHIHETLFKSGLPLFGEQEIWFSGSRLRRILIEKKMWVQSLRMTKGPWKTISRVFSLVLTIIDLPFIYFDNFFGFSEPKTCYPPPLILEKF